MSLFDGVRNLFDKDDEEEKKKQPVKNNIPWFSPRYALDYEENKDAYDQANYYWNTGEFPVIQHDEEEKNVNIGYEQDSSTPFDLKNYYAPTSPLYYTNFREEAIQRNKEKIEEEAKNKRGTLDRVFGLISNNSLTQGLYYALDDDRNTTFIQGVKEGISYMNPFKDDVTNRKSFSDVLELMDEDPTDDKIGENVVEGLLGFAGDVLLDPLTYVTGGASAIGKVVKGSGAATKGVKYMDAAGTIIENVNDVADLGKVFNTVSDTVSSAEKVADVSAKVAQNLHKNVEGFEGYIRVLDADTAKRIIQEYDTAKRYTADEIDEMASEVTKSFNKTFFGLSEGGQDLTVFGKKVASANYFRNLGDKTIAPYYNNLANKIKQTKVASKFGANPYTKSAFTDFQDAFMPYFNEYMKRKNVSHIAKASKEATDFVQDEIGQFTKEEQDTMLKFMDEGTYRVAKEFHKNKSNLYKKALKEAKDNTPEYVALKNKLDDENALLEYLDELEKSFDEKTGLIDQTILKQAQARRDGVAFDIKDELATRSDELESVFGKPMEEFTEEELTKAKQLIEFEYDPSFGVYGTHSAISSTNKSFTDIIYDFVTNNSSYNISKSEDVTKVMNKLFADANSEDALNSLSKELRRKIKSSNSVIQDGSKVVDEASESAVKGIQKSFDNISKDDIDSFVDSYYKEVGNKDYGYNSRDVEVQDKVYRACLKFFDSELAKKAFDSDFSELVKSISSQPGFHGFHSENSVVDSLKKIYDSDTYEELVYFVSEISSMILRNKLNKEELSKMFSEFSVNFPKFSNNLPTIYYKASSKPSSKVSSAIKSSKYIDEDAISVLKNRYKAFDVFKRSLDSKYMIRTYGSDLTKIRDALVKEQDSIDKMYERLSTLKVNSDEYYNLLSDITYKKDRLRDPEWIVKTIKKNVNDPVLAEDMQNIIYGLNNLVGKGDASQGEFRELLGSLKTKINSGVAIGEIGSKGADKILKNNIVRNMSIDDRLAIAKNIKESNQMNFYKYLDSLSNDDIYAKYFSPASNATDKTKSLVYDYQCKKATVYTDTGAKLDLSKLDEGTIGYLKERIQTGQNALNESIYTTTKELKEHDIAFAQAEEAIVDSYLKKNYYLTDEMLSAVKTLDPESEMFKFMQKFQNKMADIASKEKSLGVLSEGQVSANTDSYVMHKLTPEAQKAFATNPKLKERLGYYAEGVSVTKRSNKTRQFTTIEEGERALRKEFPNFEGKFFETDLAELYCARCIDSDRLIGQKENMQYIYDKLSFPYEGKGSLTASRDLVVDYEELTKALMKRQDVKPRNLGDEYKTIDYEVLRQFGIDPDYVTSNNPLIRISEEGYEALNEYLDAGLTELEELAGTRSLTKRTVSGYTFDPNVIDAVNQNSMKQNNLTESAFWQLYDKFMSTYKMVNTIYSPSFYGNNAIGNAFNSFLYSGAAALDPKKLKIARGIASTGDPNQFLILHGERYSYKQLRDICGRLGISNTSFYEHEIRQDAKGFANMKLNKKLLEVSSGIEDTQRIALFVEALDNTGDFDKAVDVVNKFLFDYSNLTDFEHKVMKRAIPFYTFMRKNAPLQLEQIMCNPRIYRNLQYGFNNFETLSGENYAEPYERNKWREDYVQLPFQINGENVGFNLNLPYEQLDRLTPNKIIGQTSPFIKAVPELLSGKYAYTGMDINGVGEYIGNQISPFRIANTAISKDTPLDKVLYGLSQSGINFATVDNQLANQQELIEQYYPYVNADNVGFEEEDMLSALLNKIRSGGDE